MDDRPWQGPLPTLTEQKLLPEGLHDMTLEQIGRLFAPLYERPQRRKLFQKLTAYMTELRNSDLNAWVILNGSFVMACVDEPGDIDLIVVMPADWERSDDLRPFEYNLVSTRAARRKYGFDVFAVRDGSEEKAKWIEFFTQVDAKWSRPPHGLPIDCKKGLVRIMP